LLGLGLSGLIAGCAQPKTWSRAETPAYEVQNELERCWSEAEAAVPDPLVPFQPQPSFGLIPTPNGMTHGSVVAVPNPEPAGADVSVLQRRNQRVNQCMQSRGFTPSTQ
jgi:hypothetical protein